MDSVFEISDIDFDHEVKRSTLPVLVFFYSPTCRYCRNEKAIFSELAKEKSSKAKFVKMDISKNYLKSREYKIKGVPHFVIFKQGKIISSFSGFYHKFQLSDRLMMFGI